MITHNIFLPCSASVTYLMEVLHAQWLNIGIHLAFSSQDTVTFASCR